MTLFANSSTTIVYNDNQIVITDNGEVYVDGEKYTEEIENVSLSESKPVQEENLYHSKNVDLYNKWYNNRIKNHKPKSKNCLNFFKYFGATVGIGIFIILMYKFISYLVKRNKKREKNKIIISTIEEIQPAIKNKNV
jgi:hypothetical protein